MSRKGGDEAGKEEENKPLQWQAGVAAARSPASGRSRLWTHISGFLT